MMHTTSALGVSAKRVLGKIFLTVLLATFGLSARAAVPTLAVNFDSTGSNFGTGPNVDIAWRFSIANPISVTELGFWDEQGDGLGESHAVAIWNTSGLGDLASALVSGTVAAGTGSPFHPGSQFRIVNVTATVLPVGDYVIGARLTGLAIDAYKDAGINNLVFDPGINNIQKRFDGNHASFARPENTGTGSGLFGPNFAFSTVSVPGDFNHDNKVDAADYVVWRKGLGPTYTQIDYGVWRTHFGQPAGSGAGATASATVPEPATLMLMSLAAACGYLRRRRAA